MLKKEITYDDFDGVSHTETFYFNIAKHEIVELESEQKGGFTAWMQEIMKAEDNKTIVQVFKRIVGMAYGERSEDGKRFIKTETSGQEFIQSAPFDVLFMELCTDEAAMANFIKGVVPKDVAGKVEAAVKELTEQGKTPADLVKELSQPPVPETSS